MAKSKVLITGALHPEALKLFHGNTDLDVTNEPDCPRDRLLTLVGNAQVLVTRSETSVDRQVIDSAPNLKVVARAAVGVGNIDIDYATEKGILVINCPGKNTNSAAELTMGLIISMLRRIPSAFAHLKSGGWDRHRYTGEELREKTLGIVGLGNVGHRVAKFAHGFDMEVLAYDPYVSPEVFTRNGAVAVEDLKELAARVDLLSVHVPLNKETRGMVDADVIAKMKPGSFLVNAARGGIVDESAVVEALKNDHIAGYAVDTFQNEPTPSEELVADERVWCTQHIGASTKQAQLAIGETVYDQVCKALDGGVVDYPVNLPDIGVPDDSSLKSYAVLAQKLGSLIGQMLGFNPQSFEVAYRGDLAGMDTSLVKLGLMKGYAAHVVDSYVSFVNTSSHFEKLGVQILERDDPSFESYKSALKVVVRGAKGETFSVGGIVFDGVYPRVSLLNDFYFEIDPTGSLIVLENLDRPGVIGNVGQFLGSNEINIDTFALSRNKRGGRAMAVIRTDSGLSKAQLDALAAIDNVERISSVTL